MCPCLEGREPAPDNVVISGVQWERTVLFLKYCEKRVYCLPKNKDPADASQGPFISRVEWLYTRTESTGSFKTWILNPSRAPRRH